MIKINVWFLQKGSIELVATFWDEKLYLSSALKIRREAALRGARIELTYNEVKQVESIINK